MGKHNLAARHLILQNKSIIPHLSKCLRLQGYFNAKMFLLSAFFTDLLFVVIADSKLISALIKK